jgi:hypothetical protein
VWIARTRLDRFEVVGHSPDRACQSAVRLSVGRADPLAWPPELFLEQADHREQRVQVSCTLGGAADCDEQAGEGHDHGCGVGTALRREPSRPRAGEPGRPRDPRYPVRRSACRGDHGSLAPLSRSRLQCHAGHRSLSPPPHPPTARPSTRPLAAGAPGRGLPRPCISRGSRRRRASGRPRGRVVRAGGDASARAVRHR